MRRWAWALGVLAVSVAGGCGESSVPDLVWGRRGINDGELIKPRAIAIDPEDRLYLVDWTARIQVFDLDGNYLGPTWTTPDYRNGRPSGLSIDRHGNLIVSDSHYGCVRIYSSEGKELRSFGELGTKPGQLGYVSDVVQDAAGYYYVAEFGAVQRISKFDEAGRFCKCWGSAGSEPGRFARIRALAIGPEGNLYAADACNHRIQVFDTDGTLVRIFGRPGKQPGEFAYPYDLDFSRGDTPFLYVVEYGNQRVQKLTPLGEPVAVWGTPGRKPGQLYNPWALAVDRFGRVHIVDSENHRVQRIRF